MTKIKPLFFFFNKKQWDNLKVFNGCLTVFSVVSIIGISFGFAKYYDVLVILNKSINVFDSMILTFSATYLGLRTIIKIDSDKNVK